MALLCSWFNTVFLLFALALALAVAKVKVLKWGISFSSVGFTLFTK
jgi:hypothetical protein